MPISYPLAMVKRKSVTHERDPKIQDDSLGRRQFISRVAVCGDADEVTDGNAESRHRRRGNSRSLVSTQHRPVGQATNHIPMGQQVFVPGLSGVSSPVWAVCV